MEIGSPLLWRCKGGNLKKILITPLVLLVSVTAGYSNAQEGFLHDMGWLTTRPGSEVDGQSSVGVTGNQSQAGISSSGGKAGVAANVGGYINLVSTVQANSAGLNALSMRSSQVKVVQNQVNGFVNAIGGAATANAAIVSGGQSRKLKISVHLVPKDLYCWVLALCNCLAVLWLTAYWSMSLTQAAAS
jgi:hypothetical protein